MNNSGLSILQQSEEMHRRAEEIIRALDLVGLWKAVGGKANLVGSFRMNLMASRLDIDLHVYTEPFAIADSFSVMGRLAEKSGIRSISYTNLIDAPDRCLEWHASYEDNRGETWHLDIIHILNDSKYAGYFERVADRISAALTDETREAILRIKFALPSELHVMGIEVYRAVLEGGVRDLDTFTTWRNRHPAEGILNWMP